MLYRHCQIRRIQSRDVRSRVRSPQLAHDYQPTTVRGLMYRAVAVGLFPDTDDSYYQQTMRTMLKLRR
jgi:hypothetical protein